MISFDEYIFYPIDECPCEVKEFIITTRFKETHRGVVYPRWVKGECLEEELRCIPE